MFEIVGREEQVFEQWEQGVKLSNPCMKAGDEVVFRNSSGATYVMIAQGDGVEVPNKMLQMTCNILVDLKQGNEQHDDCQTVFEVNPAEKPDDYVYVDNTIRKQEVQSGGGGGGVILLYSKNSRLYKDERCAENDEVSKEEALAYARSGVVVKDDGFESYMLVTGVYSEDYRDYATVNTSGIEFYTKEFSSGGPM